MKFTFKIQQYQTDAVDAVVNVFEGQPFNDGFSYVQDLGSRNELSFTTEGFANAPIAAGVDLLRNIRKIQHYDSVYAIDINSPFDSFIHPCEHILEWIGIHNKSFVNSAVINGS